MFLKQEGVAPCPLPGLLQGECGLSQFDPACGLAQLRKKAKASSEELEERKVPLQIALCSGGYQDHIQDAAGGGG